MYNTVEFNRGFREEMQKQALLGVGVSPITSKAIEGAPKIWNTISSIGKGAKNIAETLGDWAGTASVPEGFQNIVKEKTVSGSKGWSKLSPTGEVVLNKPKVISDTLSSGLKQYAPWLIGGGSLLGAGLLLPMLMGGRSQRQQPININFSGGPSQGQSRRWFNA